MKHPKKRQCLFRKGLALAAFCTAALPLPAHAAITNSAAVSSNGRDVFELFFYGKGDGPYRDQISTRAFTRSEMQDIAMGWKIWADVLEPGASDNQPAGIGVTPYNAKGNSASTSFESAKKLNTRDAAVLHRSLRIAHECGAFA